MSHVCFRDYAAIVFFANNRFETGKRKLQYLTFQDFAFCAGQLIDSWTVGAVGELFLAMFSLLFSASFFLNPRHKVHVQHVGEVVLSQFGEWRR